MPIQTYLWENRFKSIGLGSVAYLVVKIAMPQCAARRARARARAGKYKPTNNFWEFLGSSTNGPFLDLSINNRPIVQLTYQDP